MAVADAGLGALSAGPDLPFVTSRETPVQPFVNAVGLSSRGVFFVDPAAALPVVPGRFAAVPEDPEGRWTFGMYPRGGGVFDPVLAENRCLQPPLASAVQNIALRFSTLFAHDGLHLVIGEGNSYGDHATHYGGSFVDIYTNLANAGTERFLERRGQGPDPYVAGLPVVASYLKRGGKLTYEESIALWLAMAVIDSRQFTRLIFEEDVVLQLARSYAAQQGVAFRADSIQATGNRTHFFHMHLENEPQGSSRTCDIAG